MRIAKHVRKLEEYVPGEQPKTRNVIKLNTNENPYPPSPKCRAALHAFDCTRLRRYPDPNCTELCTEIAKLNHTTPDRVFVGNGSDEILALAAKCFVENDEKIGSLDPSYSLYKTLAAIRDVEWVGLEKDVRHETGDKKPGEDERRETSDKSLASQVSCLTSSTSLFLLTNPNAPTGEFREPAEIAKFAKRFKGVVIVDEAYGDFARANCMSLATAEKNRNLIVMRTFSKSYSLAGLRVGYCVGPKDLIRAMYKVKDSYNVDALAQTVALAAIRDQAWMRKNAEKVIRSRRRLTAELERRGWDVIPSESNFVFARPPQRGRDIPVACEKRGRDIPVACEKEAFRIFSALRERNIFVRYFRGPKTGDRLRVTIGTEPEMKKLLKTLYELNS